MAKHKDLGRIIALWNKVGGDNGVADLLAGKTKVVPVDGNVLTIDRTVRPVYPDWAKVVMHPELEVVGPSNFDLSTLPLYLHPAQKKDGRIEGHNIYALFKEFGLIEHALDLRVGEELVKHPHLWPVAWKDKYVFLWKSVVRNFTGALRVPFVFEHAGVVCVCWRWLDSGWGDSNPAVLSAS